MIKAAKRGIDMKLNVKPIYIGLIHEYVFEGPCRFGQGEELTKEFEIIANRQFDKEFKEDIQKHLNIREVNILEPLYVERYDNMLTDEALMEKMAEDDDIVDLYVIGLEIARGDLVIEFGQRTTKPVAVVPENCCMIAECIAAMRSRGLEAYGYMTWEEAVTHMKALRVRKVLRNTVALLAPRWNSNNSKASDATFVSLEYVTQVLGTRFRVVSAHELMDQLRNVDPTTNPTMPGIKANNLNDEDWKEINKITDDLIASADDCAMEKEALAKSVAGYCLVQKLLKVYGCNAFSMPCPDICASRRLNEEQLTFCLTHSLNNEQGIPSACEYDLNALLSLQVLNNIAYKAAYMGNTNPILYENGIAQPRRVVTEEHLKDIKNEPNLYFTFHSTPNRKLKGFDAPAESYGIQPFAHSGWGGTLRYDFAKDAGQVITMFRFSPDCKKAFVAKGTIKGSGGYDEPNCTMSVIFQVEDQKDFFNKQINFGNHMPLVYGDYTKELIMLVEALGLEVVTA